MVCLVACSKVPSSVIQPEDMAQLMADVHTADAFLDYNRLTFPSDSDRQRVRQSVLAAHGVSQQQLDSAFGWYGRNITFYMDVYDRTIQILETRLTETGNRIAAAALSVAGDSVDVWADPRAFTISSRTPTRFISFTFDADQNSAPGDYYIWRAKFINNRNAAHWTIAAHLPDGAIAYNSSSFEGDGWQEISFQTDSTAPPSSFFGYLALAPSDNTQIVIDSIELIRKRINPDTYQRRYSTRIIKDYFTPDTIAQP